MPRTKSIYLALLAVLLSPMAANADPISLGIEVSASDWSVYFGDGSEAPVDPFLLDFSITFDNSADIGQTMSGLIINSFNLGYTLSYAYNFSVDTLILATSPNTSGCSHPASSACLFFGDISSVSPDLFFVQQTTPTSDGWSANSIDASYQSVPEPGTLALLGIGLLGMGAARRKKA